MTVKELLVPRWKVIAEYPKSVFNIGDIIINNSDQDEYEYINWEDYGKDIYYPNNYPGIFKSLSWWEERKEKDLPIYIWLNGGVLKVTQYNLKGGEFWFEVIEDEQLYNLSLPLRNTLPATEQEYLNQ